MQIKVDVSLPDIARLPDAFSWRAQAIFKILHVNKSQLTCQMRIVDAASAKVWLYREKWREEAEWKENRKRRPSYLT